MGLREDVLAAVNAAFDKLGADATVPVEDTPMIPTAAPSPQDQAATMPAVEQPPETFRPEPVGETVQAVNNVDPETGATVPTTDEVDEGLVKTLEGLGPKAIDRLKELLK